MKRSSTPSYILTLPLLLEQWQKDRLDTDFRVACDIYNSLRRELLNRYNQMTKTKKYRYWSKMYRKSKPRSEQCKEAKEQLAALRVAYRISGDAIEKDIKKYQHHFKKNVHSAVAQKLAAQLWGAFEDMIFGRGKSVHFKKYENFTSVEGKSNSTGIVFDNGFVESNGTRYEVLINEKDTYVQQALACRVKFCRLQRKFIRGHWKYYVQLILEGTPPIKVTKDGEIKRAVGAGRVGLDIGPQTLAVASEKAVKLFELADRVQSIENELRVINRAMDRSRRMTNRKYFNKNGTVIKRNPHETRKWRESNHYKELAVKRKELYRKQADLRKQQHNELANYIISLGDEVYIENMNFAALVKRAKETTKSEKTGKFKFKKRFGKSIANKAPAMFVSILEKKLNSVGGHLYRVKTTEMKASQYRHDTMTYKKSQLSERTKEISGHTVQRDLYSAFLLMNSASTLDKPDQQLCEKTFNDFLILHGAEISRLKQLRHTPSSMGVKFIKAA